MSCCSNPSSKACPSRYAVWFPRIAFGLVLAGFGVSHYRNLTGFLSYAQGPFQSIPVLAAVAAALAYVVPALMIVGGVLFAVKQLCPVSKVCILLSLSGIIGWAGLGTMVGPSDAAGNMMSAIQSAAVLLILYYVIRKMSKCCANGGASCCTTPQTTH